MADDCFAFAALKSEGARIEFDAQASTAEYGTFKSTWFEVPIPVELEKEFAAFYDQRMTAYQRSKTMAPLTGQDLRTMRDVGINGAGFQTQMAKELEARLNAQSPGSANEYANAYSPRGSMFNEALGRFSSSTNEYLADSKLKFPDPDGPKHLAAANKGKGGWGFTDVSAVPASWPEVDAGIGMPSVKPT